MVIERPGASLVRRLRALGGCARAGDVARDAREARELRRLVAEGVIQRVAPGTYALLGTDPAVIVARRTRALLTCGQAVRLHGLATLHPPDLHLSVERGRGTPRHPGLPPVTWHHEDVPVDRSGASPVMPLEPALARMCVCAPAVDAIAALDAALAAGRVTLGRVEAFLPRRDLGRLRSVLARADGRSQSPIETVARLALRAAGFHVQPQALVDGVGWVDLLVEGTVVVELDGFAYHSGRDEYRNDRWRDRELHARGFVVLRFTFEDVMRSPDRIVAAVQAVLRARQRGMWVP